MYVLYIYIVNTYTNPNIRVSVVLAHLLPFCLSFYVSLGCFNLFKKTGILAGIVILFFSMLGMVSLGYLYSYKLLTLAGIVLFDSQNWKMYVQTAFTGYMQYFIYALLYFMVGAASRRERSLRYLQEEKFELEREKKQQELENALLKQQELKIQQEKLELEYAFLRSQINPHFLHNTLNVLFSQALMHSQELADNIMKLSQLMRYAMESFEATDGKVSIKNELQHLQTLIDIHQVRFSGALQIQLTVEGEMNGHALPPLSIITIVENAFKYGDLKDASRPLLIRVCLLEDRIYFYCHNKKKAIPSLELPSHNIGLSNLSKRLDLSFKNRYEIQAQNATDSYTFELTIKK
ncbi:two-component system sensor protein, no kinase domain [Filimonas lacunae]|nr:two-component system sensor protein, no kinase domain [Filimonas lacunae]